jgi:hypothetical protein
VILGYTFISFMAGSLFFLSEKVMQSQWLDQASLWNLWSTIFFGGVSALSVFSSNNIRLGPSVYNFSTNQARTYFPWEIPAFFFAVLASISGSAVLFLFSTALYLAGAAGGRAKSIFFLLLLVAGIIFLLPTAAFGKRLLIFPLAIALLLVWRDGVIRSKTFYPLFVLTFLAILPLSIMRGYGNFGAESFVDAIQYVNVYVTSDYFLTALGNNTESVTFYFHGVNALQIALQSDEYLWGETLINVFFLGSSLYGFDDGLRSSIEIYTLENYPSFRAIGGSYPVMILSEFVMNFGVFSILIFPLFLITIDAIWRKISCINEPTMRFSLEAILLYTSILLARGSSFDLFFFNLIVMSLPILVLVPGISRRNSRSDTHT